MRTAAADSLPTMIVRCWSSACLITPLPISPSCPSSTEMKRNLFRLLCCGGGNAGFHQRGIFQQRQPPLANGRELRQIFLGDRIGGRQAELLEIFVVPALQNAEVQMWTGGKPGAADEADGFADFDVLANAHKHARQMQVHGLVAIGM